VIWTGATSNVAPLAPNSVVLFARNVDRQFKAVTVFGKLDVVEMADALIWQPPLGCRHLDAVLMSPVHGDLEALPLEQRKRIVPVLESFARHR